MKNIWKVTEESYTIELYSGIKRYDAERRCDPNNYASGDSFSDDSWDFETQKEADAFAKTFKPKIEASRTFSGVVEVTVAIALIDRIEIDEDGDEIYTCEIYSHNSLPEAEEIMRIALPHFFDDEDEDDE